MAYIPDELALRTAEALDAGDIPAGAAVLCEGYVGRSREPEPLSDAFGAAGLRTLLAHIEVTPDGNKRVLGAPVEDGVSAVLEDFAFAITKRGATPVDSVDVLRIATERSRDLIGRYFADREIPEMSAPDAVLVGLVLENGGMKQRLERVLQRTNAAAEIVATKERAPVDREEQRLTLHDRTQSLEAITAPRRHVFQSSSIQQ